MKKYIYLTLTIAWMAVIYMFSAQTSEVSGAESVFLTEKILRLFIDNPSEMLLDVTETVFRKLCHFGEYGVLAAFWYITLKSFGLSSKKLWLTVCICAFYSITDEVHQFFVPGRACRVYDIVIDTLGSTVGYFLCRFVDKIRMKKFTNR
ncbi:MAG: VanZ family protein [Clostridia bacterium]|nr:VanZ family protein [Clostridia bacterium]